MKLHREALLLSSPLCNVRALPEEVSEEKHLLTLGFSAASGMAVSTLDQITSTHVAELHSI